MADETNENISSDAPQTFSKEDVERMTKGRLKKHVEEAEQLKSHNADLQAQLAALQQSGGAPAPAPAPVPPGESGVPAGGGENPLTADNAKKLLDEYHQNMQANQAAQYAQQKIQELRSADPDFHKLATEGLKVPEPVSISIMNRLAPEVGKNLLKTLLSNTYENTLMENHYLKGEFETWLSQKMNNEKGTMTTPPAPEPDLQGDSIKGDTTPAYENAMDAYMKGKV